MRSSHKMGAFRFLLCFMFVVLGDVRHMSKKLCVMRPNAVLHSWRIDKVRYNNNWVLTTNPGGLVGGTDTRGNSAKLRRLLLG